MRSRNYARASAPERAAFVALFVALAGCGGARIPDAKAAALAYAAAAKRGDADALYDLLSAKGRRSLTREEVRAIVKDERAELADQATAVSSQTTTLKSEAHLRFADGEEALLSVEPDGYKLTAAEALPAAADTPVEALGQLRGVLARRSYAGLIRVLSRTTRAAMEDHVRSLVEGLENPEGLDIQVTGDTAVVSLPGGHEVHLRRDAGAWRIDDFD